MFQSWAATHALRTISDATNTHCTMCAMYRMFKTMGETTPARRAMGEGMPHDTSKVTRSQAPHSQEPSTQRREETQFIIGSKWRGCDRHLHRTRMVKKRRRSMMSTALCRDQVFWISPAARQHFFKKKKKTKWLTFMSKGRNCVLACCRQMDAKRTAQLDSR